MAMLLMAARMGVDGRWGVFAWGWGVLVLNSLQSCNAALYGPWTKSSMMQCAGLLLQHVQPAVACGGWLAVYMAWCAGHVDATCRC
jgi:hypothetical protein